MGLDMELEFDKYCRLSESPNTVLPFPLRRSGVARKSNKVNRKDQLRLEEDFKELKFQRYRSASCKNTPSCKLEGSEVLKRGSVYQSSREIRKLHKGEAVEGRSKIELSGSEAKAFSLEILDTLCSSNDDNLTMESKRSSVRYSVMSLNSDSGVASVSSAMSSEEFLDLSSPNIVNHVSDSYNRLSKFSRCRDSQSSENDEGGKIANTKFKCDPIITPVSDGNGLREKDVAMSLHKSLSAKLEIPHSPSQSESDNSRPSSPKSRFSPIRKMFDPFTKSKSLRSPLGYASSSGGLPPARPSSIRPNSALRKSLLKDFSNTSLVPEVGPQMVRKDLCEAAVLCSPAHLHGSLKLENKNGVPCFEFSLKCPEDVLVAQTWKSESARNWVYTFHSLHNRRKSNVSGWGLKELNKESPMVGQMQVSCYLCTELKDAGAFDNSMVTEFVMHDVATSRRSVSDQGNPSHNQSPDVDKPPKVSNPNAIHECTDLDDASDQLKPSAQQIHATEKGHLDSSKRIPKAATELRPSFETAAVVIQIPLEKRESLKYKGGDVKNEQPHLNLRHCPSSERRMEGFNDYSSRTKMNVVIPSGRHGLPCTESHGPSPLLDRWRLGGGCECGGWDMACPLTVFGNSEDQLVTVNQHPLKLFAQGSKEKMPALMMTFLEDGRYSVDFHARLSTLQAFSICVAVLHCTEASAAVRQEEGDKQLLKCNSLRLFIEEEVKSLIEAVTVEEEKRKVERKIKENTTPPFKLNPPFSPIARV